jgi:HSP20 family protein
MQARNRKYKPIPTRRLYMKNSNGITNDHPLYALDHFFDFELKGLSDLNYMLPPKKQNHETCNFEVHDDGEKFIATLDLPGVKKKDLDLKLVSNELTLKAKRSKKGNDSSEEHSIQYSITIGDKINTDQIQASLEDGVLEIILPKAEELKVMQVTIK